MRLHLHNPSSLAHLSDLRARLRVQLAVTDPPGYGPREGEALVEALLVVVRRMDEGAISPLQAARFFARYHVPGFSFGRWLRDMVDEGVYVGAPPDAAPLNHAA
ncbi:hypothetical protein [Rubellimicrobium sp. CFH 75288]|uniref:hypothetical protein n=1 Tax=Rubellimicrobium sp. CFH 75288 TaxID=2697034 RepID=UPI001411C7A2|nr:hypothetical protein [Rubellimicrobium sp. CFH 75288]NAZ36219.1 hypothetical protein [Rubellimicrobium sp. CFH 75288]